MIRERPRFGARDDGRQIRVDNLVIAVQHREDRRIGRDARAVRPRCPCGVDGLVVIDAGLAQRRVAGCDSAQLCFSHLAAIPNAALRFDVHRAKEPCGVLSRPGPAQHRGRAVDEIAAGFFRTVRISRFARAGRVGARSQAAVVGAHKRCIALDRLHEVQPRDVKPGVPGGRKRIADL